MEGSPERDLAIDVLRQAIDDVEKPTWREHVRRWVAGEGRFGMSFVLCCELVGMAPDTVRCALRRRLEVPNDETLRGRGISNARPMTKC